MRRSKGKNRAASADRIATYFAIVKDSTAPEYERPLECDQFTDSLTSYCARSWRMPTPCITTTERTLCHFARPEVDGCYNRFARVAAGLFTRLTRRGGRVAEGGGLLNRCTVKSCTGGSNPPLSARFFRINHLPASQR